MKTLLGILIFFFFCFCFPYTPKPKCDVKCKAYFYYKGEVVREFDVPGWIAFDIKYAPGKFDFDGNPFLADSVKVQIIR